MSPLRARRNLRVVTLTGGTGGFNVARGFGDLAIGERTHIVNIGDSGGDSGNLRTEQGVLPPGDARRLILATMDTTNPMAPFMAYRFPEGQGSPLKDRSLGNLILAASEQLYGRSQASQAVAKVCGCRASIYPISTNDCHLIAELSDGSEMMGEGLIDTRSLKDDRYVLRVRLDRSAYICAEADKAIREADVIVLGPGDLYTSIIPLLLVDGLADAISASAGQLIYIVNLMTKYAETRGFSAKDFVELPLLRYGVGRKKFDAILVNEGRIPKAMLDKYFREEKAEPVILHAGEKELLFKGSTHRIVTGDFVSERALQQGLIHHDGTRLAHAVMGLMEPGLPVEPRIFVVDLDDTLANTTKDLQGDVGRIEFLTLVPGARQFLGALSHAGHRRVLLSAGEIGYQERKLEVLGINDMFDSVHIVEKGADKRERLKRLLDESGLPPEHMIVVGDNPEHELLYAHELGCRVVRVNLSHGKRRSMRCAHEPHLVIDTFVDCDIGRMC